MTLDLAELGIETRRPFQVHDLLTDARYLWSGSRNFVLLDPVRGRPISSGCVIAYALSKTSTTSSKDWDMADNRRRQGDSPAAPGRITIALVQGRCHLPAAHQGILRLQR